MLKTERLKCQVLLNEFSLLPQATKRDSIAMSRNHSCLSMPVRILLVAAIYDGEQHFFWSKCSPWISGKIRYLLDKHVLKLVPKLNTNTLSEPDACQPSATRRGSSISALHAVHSAILVWNNACPRWAEKRTAQQTVNVCSATYFGWWKFGGSNPGKTKGPFMCCIPSRKAQERDRAQFDEKSRRAVWTPNPVRDKTKACTKGGNGRHLLPRLAQSDARIDDFL